MKAVAVAVGELDGRAIAVSRPGDRTLRVWDLATGTQIGAALTGHTNWVWAVAVGELDGRAIAVSGAGDQTLRVWDLATGTQRGAPLTGHTGVVEAVAVGKLDGCPIAVSGSDDQTLRVWDLAGSDQSWPSSTWDRQRCHRGAKPTVVVAVSAAVMALKLSLEAGK